MWPILKVYEVNLSRKLVFRNEKQLRFLRMTTVLEKNQKFKREIL
jgi:hypothetical protein